MNAPEQGPEPEPTDSDLWPGELSFVDAIGTGEFGNLDLRVFDQDRYWVDIRQQPHLLTEMSDEYITNVIAHLLAHVKYFYFATIRRSLYQMYGDLLLGRVSTDIVAEAFGAPALTDLTPVDWLEGTPLMRALRRRAAIPPASD